MKKYSHLFLLIKPIYFVCEKKTTKVYIKTKMGLMYLLLSQTLAHIQTPHKSPEYRTKKKCHQILKLKKKIDVNNLVRFKEKR